MQFILTIFINYNHVPLILHRVEVYFGWESYLYDQCKEATFEGVIVLLCLKFIRGYSIVYL